VSWYPEKLIEEFYYDEENICGDYELDVLDFFRCEGRKIAAIG
jgi:hypothetical protein